MSAPAEVPLFDPANPYIQSVPAMVTYGVIDTPGGQRLVMTFRTPDVTFTQVVDKQTAQNWYRLMGEQITQMSSLTLAPANTPLPRLRPEG